MSTFSIHPLWKKYIEIPLVGTLEPDARRNMYVDLTAACIRSIMTAIVAFIPVILWRSGASPGQMAYYFAVTVLGLITMGVSVRLMRRWGMKRVALICWIMGRGSFLMTAFVSDTTSLLIIFTFFWLMEAWTAPAYNQTMQTIYPSSQIGRILAAVRVGLVACTLIFTPLAGWILDRFDFRVLLPLVGLSGIGSTLIFYSLLRTVPDNLSESPRPAGTSWRILKTDRRMPFYLGGMFLFGLSALMAAPLYPVIQTNRLDASYTILGQLGFLQSLAWLCGCLFGGRMLDRLRGIRSLQIVFIANAFVMLPYIWATQAWMLFPSFIAAGLVTAGTDLAILFTVLSLAGSDRVPEYSALNSLVYGLRGLAGPFLGSILMQAGVPFGAILSLGVILTVAGSIFLTWAKQ